MVSPNFESKSGLRPASAFLVVAIVLVAVSANATRIAMKEVEIDSRVRSVCVPEPDFDIVDRKGTPLAFSVPPIVCSAGGVANISISLLR